MRNNILLFYHCSPNTGYAIQSLENIFWEMALKLCIESKFIHLGYPNFEKGLPRFTPDNFDNIVKFNSKDSTTKNDTSIIHYIKRNRIETVFGFDQPPYLPVYKFMRRAGVRLFVSYWGAPMSSVNKGLKLFLKRFEVACRRYGPDHYIFESNAMAETATHGRGVSASRVSVVPLGVDTEKYKPRPLLSDYAYDMFSIPKDRKIIFYSGHMEERKGVHVIVKAARHIVEKNVRNIHFLLLGNKNGEENVFDSIYKGTPAENHITFGGYRDDIHKIHHSCHLGVIASTGWDSFTMSSLEMASSGLPLIVSELQGLKETIHDGQTGFFFPPGDHVALASRLSQLLDDPQQHRSMSIASRERILRSYTREQQVDRLVALMNTLYRR